MTSQDRIIREFQYANPANERGEFSECQGIIELTDDFTDERLISFMRNLTDTGFSVLEWERDIRTRTFLVRGFHEYFRAVQSGYLIPRYEVQIEDHREDNANLWIESPGEATNQLASMVSYTEMGSGYRFQVRLREPYPGVAQWARTSSSAEIAASVEEKGRKDRLRSRPKKKRKSNSIQVRKIRL